MYAGTTFRNHSGKFVGVHQKIDRIARINISKHVPKTIKFPNIRDILYFEGNNGPDGIKRKGSSSDEPWHFVDPKNPDDKEIYKMISNHIYNLSQALESRNNIRASFEAAWLAHAVVDGLTPAHHYPLNDKIEELWGKSREERGTVKGKIIIKGKGLKDTVSKNWQYMGVDGVFTAHLLFEAGVASIISPMKFKNTGISNYDKRQIFEKGFIEVYKESVEKIYKLKMYDEFGKNGWTWDLVNETKKILIPEIIKLVTLSWYQAVINVKEV